MGTSIKFKPTASFVGSFSEPKIRVTAQQKCFRGFWESESNSVVSKGPFFQPLKKARLVFTSSTVVDLTPAGMFFGATSATAATWCLHLSAHQKAGLWAFVLMPPVGHWEALFTQALYQKLWEECFLPLGNSAPDCLIGNPLSFTAWLKSESRCSWRPWMYSTPGRGGHTCCVHEAVVRPASRMAFWTRGEASGWEEAA